MLQVNALKFNFDEYTFNFIYKKVNSWDIKRTEKSVWLRDAGCGIQPMNRSYIAPGT